MSDQPLLVANWKMYLGYQDSLELLKEISKHAGNTSENIWIAPSFPVLPQAKELTGGSSIQIGAQSLFPETAGAYTGEVSGSMLRECGCSFTLIGHSERRERYQKTPEELLAKLKAARACDLTPVFCIGESLSDRKSGTTLQVLQTQLQPVFEYKELQESNKKSPFLIAYEPVWAIGTGESASPGEIKDVHKAIEEMFSVKGYSSTPAILYGGSVNPDNLDEILSLQPVSGVLIGGASTKAESFLKMIEIAN